jgi:hypothetical protein
MGKGVLHTTLLKLNFYTTQEKRLCPQEKLEACGWAAPANLSFFV